MESEEDDELPPTILEHFAHFNRIPTAYIYFWVIGGCLVIATALFIIPRWLEFRKIGLQMREKQNLILMPFSSSAYQLIIFFPIYASVLKYITFFHPIFHFTADYLIHCYEGIIFWLFGKLLVMYLGSIDNLMCALNEVTPKKFYAVPPFGCCLKCCCAAKNMKRTDFRLLYWFTLQYAIIAPILSYLLLLRIMKANLIWIWCLSLIEFISSMICVYGLFALMTAAHSILEKHKIHHKFWCLKLLVWLIVIPNLLITFVGPFWHWDVPGSNEYYDNHLMAENYISIMDMALFVILAYFFKKYFHPNDAVYAHKNDKYKSHNVQYSQVDQSDKVIAVTEDSDEDTDVDDIHFVGGMTNKRYSITTTPGNTFKMNKVSKSRIKVNDIFKSTSSLKTSKENAI